MTEAGIDAPLNAHPAGTKTLEDLSDCGFRKQDICTAGHQQQRHANGSLAGSIPGEKPPDELIVLPPGLEHAARRKRAERAGSGAASVSVTNRHRQEHQRLVKPMPSRSAVAWV